MSNVLDTTAVTVAERKEFQKFNYKSESLNDILESFRDDLEGIKHKELIVSVGIVLKYIPALMVGYKVNTIRSNMSNMRNIIVDVGGDNRSSLLEALKVSYKSLSKMTNKKRDVKVSQKRAVRLEKIKESNDVILSKIARIHDMLSIKGNKAFVVGRNQTMESIRAKYIYYMLALASGRRFTELTSTLHIELKRGNPHMYVTGLLKKNGELMNERHELHVLGLTNVEFRDYLREYREYMGELLAEKKLRILDEAFVKDEYKSFKVAIPKKINSLFSVSMNRGIKMVSSQLYKLEKAEYIKENKDPSTIHSMYISIPHDARGRYAQYAGEHLKVGQETANESIMRTLVVESKTAYAYEVKVF